MHDAAIGTRAAEAAGGARWQIAAKFTSWPEKTIFTFRLGRISFCHISAPSLMVLCGLRRSITYWCGLKYCMRGTR